MNYKCRFGNSLYVCGNIPALGNWDPSKALQMNWKEGDNWSSEISIMVEESPEVDYKYFIGENNFNPSEVVWENGPNRTIDAAASTAESTTPLLRSDIWEYREVRLMLRDFLPANRELYVCGDILNILKAPSPLKMKLQKSIDPLDPTETNYFWTVDLILHHSVSEFEYKYALFDKENGKYIQNRKVSKVFSRPKLETEGLFSRIKLNSFDLTSPSTETYLGYYTKVDSAKFSDFIFDQIAPKILLGAAIRGVSEVALLKENGVQAVVNLQTDRDIRKYNPNHDEILLKYQQEGIDYIHIPTKEQSTDSLVMGCIQASKTIHKLISESKVVYIHCTFGAFRSVHSFLAYHCLFEKSNMDDAIKFIKIKRPLAVSSRDLLKQIIEGAAI